MRSTPLGGTRVRRYHHCITPRDVMIILEGMFHKSYWGVVHQIRTQTYEQRDWLFACCVWYSYSFIMMCTFIVDMLSYYLHNHRYFILSIFYRFVLYIMCGCYCTSALPLRMTTGEWSKHLALILPIWLVYGLISLDMSIPSHTGLYRKWRVVCSIT